MAHFLDYLADRVLLCDGAMGTQIQARNLDIERDFLGPRELHRDPEREPPRSGARDPSRLSRSRLRRDPDQQLWRLADHPRRVRHRRPAFELNRRAAELAREAVAEFAA